MRRAPLPLLMSAHVADAARTAKIAAALALPLLGFRLVDSPQGLGLEVRLLWVVYATLAVFVGRLALNVLRSAGTALFARSGSLTRSAPGSAWPEAAGLVVLIVFALVLPWLPFGDRNAVDRATLISDLCRARHRSQHRRGLGRPS